MQEATCAACQTRVPMNEAFSVAERPFCGPCLEQLLSDPDQGNISTDSIHRMIDPTVCANCEADNGHQDWATLAGLPACTTCTDFFRNRPFPNWLKISFVVLLAVAAAAFVYNWRYFKGYVELIQGNHALNDGNIKEGMALLQSSADRLPDIPQLAVLPNLYKAQQLIAEDKNMEALALLDQSQPHVFDEWLDTFRMVRLRAEIGIAFDAKDYDTFLAKAQQVAEITPDESFAQAVVASAYACKYASTGDPAFREQALQALESAQAIGEAGDEHFAKYENRIQHRLGTREIITNQQFEQQFPDGWKPEAGE